MSAVSAFNVGLGLNFTGQSDEQGIDTGINGYPNEQYYAAYAQGMQLNSKIALIFSDYNSSPALTASSTGQLFTSRTGSF